MKLALTSPVDLKFIVMEKTLCFYPIENAQLYIELQDSL